MSLSTKPYKGARDFYPEDKMLQNNIFSIWRQNCEAYGYEEYDAPIIEPIELYLAKSGEEIVKEQSYVFSDRADRQVVIRPEMTPSVSRMVAAKRQELVYPLRLFSIPNLWRYERPQKGRLREHWQLNVDIFGVSSINAEVELIELVTDIFKSYEADSSMYQIKVNHRGLINYLLKNYLNLNQELAESIYKLIDRMHKMEEIKFIEKLDNLLSDKDKENNLTEKILMILKIKKLNNLPNEIKKTDAYDELNKLVNILKSKGIVNVIYDPSLMRGFDYYTGIIFEVYDKNPENNRSMMGGGRYDDLVSLFGVKSIPTVGFGWGDVTLINFLESHHLLPKLKNKTDAVVLIIGDNHDSASVYLKTLRKAGINIAVDFSNRKIGDKIKNATKKPVNHVIIIGGDEIKNNKLKLRNLKKSLEEELSITDIIDKLTN